MDQSNIQIVGIVNLLCLHNVGNDYVYRSAIVWCRSNLRVLSGIKMI